jgi:hypothetical protein
VQGGEQLLGHRVVVAGGGAGEQVVAEAERGEVFDDEPVVAVGELARRHPLGLGLHQDRRAVLVGAADHQDVVPRHPHVPAEDVGRHTETGHMADVARAVGVRPGDGGQDRAHAASLVSRFHGISHADGADRGSGSRTLTRTSSELFALSKRRSADRADDVRLGRAEPRRPQASVRVRRRLAARDPRCS